MFLPLTDPTKPQTSDDALDESVSHVLDWLTKPALADAARELSSLRTQLGELSALPVSVNQFHRILDLFQARADRVWGLIAAQLRDADQVIPRYTHQLARDVDELETHICDGYTRVLKDIEHRLVRNRRRDPTTVAGRALRALRNRLIIAAYLSKPAPAHLWLQAHRLYALARSEESIGETGRFLEFDAGHIYLEMLAFAAVQPERLSGMEVSATVEYLTRFATTVMILDNAPAQPNYRLFWIDPAKDAAPTAVARRLPDTRDQVLYFSCQRLGTLAAEQLRALEEGTAPQELLLPTGATQRVLLGLLHKLQESWAEPPTRHLVRRRQRYQVRMAVGLAAIACRLDDACMRPDETMLSKWTVYNESPSGYALTHEAGEIDGVVAGEIVAVRADDEKPWDICVVRRVLSERSEKVEVGLQVLASSARAVELAFRHTARAEKTMHTALLLPPLPILRAHEAVIVAAGVAGSQRFVMVTHDGKTHVTQGRIVSHDLHTACIELFQFQDDPYPL